MFSQLKLILLIWSIIECVKSSDDVELVKYTVEFIKSANKYLSEFSDANQDINWSNEIKGVTEAALKLNIKLAADLKTYIRGLNEVIARIDLNIIKDRNLQRQLKKIPDLGYDILPNKELNELNDIIYEMTEIYKNINLCSYQDQCVCNLTLIPHVQEIIHKSKDLKEIGYYWLEWRNRTGSSVKKKFQRSIQLYRKTSFLNGK